MKVVQKDNSIPVHEMKDGQIGRIVRWSILEKEFVGRIVQRVGSNLVTLGMGAGEVFDTAIKLSNQNDRVEVLKPGTILEI